MDLHTSYACDACIARFIGPALCRVVADTPKSVRDKCYGCGREDVQVRTFTYFYPYPSDEQLLGKGA